jgi:hypothetical protein
MGCCGGLLDSANVNRSNRRLLGTVGIALVVIVALSGAGIAFWPSEDADREFSIQAESTRTPFPTAVVRVSERRPNSCPTAVAMRLDPSRDPGRLVMALGPIVMHFAPDAIGPQSELYADRIAGRLGWKLPMTIDAPVGTAISVRGHHSESGNPATYEGPSIMTGAPRPQAEWKFVPGALYFPESGCYQIYVSVDGVEHGPFGMEVRERS